MPLFRKKKDISRIKELEGYLNKILESNVPPNYEVTAYSTDHQALDALVRPNWEILHPIVQDFIYSWFIEVRAVAELKEELEKKLHAVNQELMQTKEISINKIDELNKKLNNRKAEVLNAENELKQKVEFFEELTKAIEDKEVGGEELKQKMENRIKNMREGMIRQHEKFEASQIKIGNQFKNRVIELDEERLRLNEKIEKNKEIIVQLGKENYDLMRRNHLLKGFQSRLVAINSIIDSIPSNILPKEGNKNV